MIRFLTLAVGAWDRQVVVVVRVLLVRGRRVAIRSPDPGGPVAVFGDLALEQL